MSLEHPQGVRQQARVIVLRVPFSFQRKRRAEEVELADLLQPELPCFQVYAIIYHLGGDDMIRSLLLGSLGLEVFLHDTGKAEPYASGFSNRAAVPSSASISSNRLYFAIRSERQAEPVLI